MTQAHDLIFEELKAIQDDVIWMKGALNAMRVDIRDIEGHVASLTATRAAWDIKFAGLAARVGSIERRLDLVEG
jgi:hypothetical protein